MNNLSFKSSFAKKMLPFAILAISLQSCGENATKTEEKNTTKTAETAVKKGNFEGFDVAQQVYEFDASEEKNIITDAGTKIKFLPNNFVDKSGNIIKGKVKITFREFHDLADIMASGIQMTYDSAGVKHNFESAGMFELRGSQNGQDIFIAKEKPVKLDLISQKNGAFNQYYLEETKQNTAFIKPKAPQNNWLIASAYAQEMPQTIASRIVGKWNITMKSQLPTPNTEKAKKIAELEEKLPKQPAKPQQYNANEPILDFNISNIKEFPELATFQNIVWQYGGEKGGQNDPQKNDWIFKTTWSQVKLQSINAPGGGIKYNLSLKNDTKEFSTQIIPALRGKQLENAELLFQQKNKEYEIQVQKLGEEAEKIKKELEKVKIQGDFVRSFQVQMFGISNCDIIGSFSMPVAVNLTFGTISVNQVFLVMGKRAVVDVTRGGSGRISNLEKFTFDASSQNQIFAVVKEKGKQKFYHFSKKDFANVNIEQAKNTKKLDINLTPVAIENMAQLREVMN